MQFSNVEKNEITFEPKAQFGIFFILLFIKIMPVYATFMSPPKYSNFQTKS